MGGKCRTASNTVEIKWRASNWGLLQKRFDYKINERDGLTLFSGNIIPTEIIIHWQMKSVKAYLQNKGMDTRAKEENRNRKERGETKITLQWEHHDGPEAKTIDIIFHVCC